MNTQLRLTVLKTKPSTWQALTKDIYR